ncbi:MAG: response regulator [Deltaproteobacteria bacterium]|jgi:putative two-component system response regulator|nr:response regulator [Deltaproteobacteria bacterium]
MISCKIPPPISNNPEILFVDDDPEDISSAREICGNDFSIKSFHSVDRMLDYVKFRRIPKMIFFDIDFHDADGYEAIRYLNNSPRTTDIPLIVLTAKHDVNSAIRSLNCGAVDYLPKPFLRLLFKQRVLFHLALAEQKQKIKAQAALIRSQYDLLTTLREKLLETVDENTGNVTGIHSAILETVADLVDNSDNDEQNVLKRRDLNVLIGAINENGLYSETCDWDNGIILQSSRLYDVGKLAIGKNILMKPTKLTAQEYETVKKHTTLGVEMLEKIETKPNKYDFLRYAKIFAGTHHERWDGSGYPFGLRGYDIPLAGRLMAIADVYEGLTSKRPYKKPVSHQEAVNIILSGKGTHFDPTLVEIFAQVADQFEPAE